MKVIITGSAGLLGQAVTQELLARDHSVLGIDITPKGKILGVPLDLMMWDKVESLIRKTQPNALIHCAAWSNADTAEMPENYDKVWQLNVEVTARLAHLCEELDIEMVFVSSAQVFDGTGTRPYKISDPTERALNVYGKSKAVAEKQIVDAMARYYIVRTSWLYGMNDSNFVRMLLRLGKIREEIPVVTDQIGHPTYTVELAKRLVEMTGSGHYGIYHVAGGGEAVSRYAFAKEIFSIAMKAGYQPMRKGGPHLVPVETKELLREVAPDCVIARRPENGRLDQSALEAGGFTPMIPWEDALTEYISNIMEADKSV